MTFLDRLISYGQLTSYESKWTNEIQRAQETIAGIDNISLEQNVHSRWSGLLIFV